MIPLKKQPFKPDSLFNKMITNEIYSPKKNREINPHELVKLTQTGRILTSGKYISHYRCIVSAAQSAICHYPKHVYLCALFFESGTRDFRLHRLAT